VRKQRTRSQNVTPRVKESTLSKRERSATKRKSVCEDNQKETNQIDNDDEIAKKSKSVSMSELAVNTLVQVAYGLPGQKQIYLAKIVKFDEDNKKLFVHYVGWNDR
jgi:hypothetical protein